ncbi:hypothetical protein HD806DRAFT_27609 [Xylariaceae sp. AK1471]|nr:hypothetical protein HD806DRAFT_27609 [Xylariaceae sp. AK1471]
MEDLNSAVDDLQLADIERQAGVSFIEDSTSTTGDQQAAEDQPEAVAEFSLFGKLPTELQDRIWERAIPSEVIHSDDAPQEDGRPRTTGMPAIASACRNAREVVLRHGVWLNTILSSTPMFFMPGRTVLYCGGRELTVTADQVLRGLHPVLMRLGVRYNALNRLARIYVVASDGEVGRIPGTWPRTYKGSTIARLEGTRVAHLSRPSEEFVDRMASDDNYCPSTKWAWERWTEVRVAAERAWLLASWYTKDPAGVSRDDIMDPSAWSEVRNKWIRTELLVMPVLMPAYVRNASEED